MNPDLSKRFQMWFSDPFEWLRHKKNLPEERQVSFDGGFVAMSMGCMLCERYFRAKTNTEKPLERGESKKKKNKGYNERFKREAAKELGISKSKFDIFWAVYRHGIQHQGMPRKVYRKYAGRTITYRSLMSENNTHTPEQEIDGDIIWIKISPWKFTKRMIELFERDSAALESGFHHAFADIFQK
ncbi:hypothetical protein [Cerasicoccus arenae]|nr:hypothetical protein [Cerasicoccus arenae]MBK1858253.1 hypothetical protein [Cerasicoccus arenae]